ncbi:hypothetical protein TrRE_jg12239, partial [Triparma retinervis]
MPPKRKRKIATLVDIDAVDIDAVDIDALDHDYLVDDSVDAKKSTKEGTKGYHLSSADAAAAISIFIANSHGDPNKKGKKKKKKKKAPSNKAPSKKAKGSGTGYGNAMTAAQRKKRDAQVEKAAEVEMTKDAQVKVLLTNFSRCLVGGGGGEEIDSEDAAKVKELLNSYLRNDSLVDVGRRKDLYSAVLSLVSHLCRDIVLGASFFGDGTTLGLLENLGTQARVFKSINSRHLDCDDGGGVDVLGEDADKVREETEDVVNALAGALHIEEALADMTKARDSARAIGLLEGGGGGRREK